MSIFAVVDPNTLTMLHVLQGDAQLAPFFPNTSNPSLLDADTLRGVNIYPLVITPPAAAPMAEAVPCPYQPQIVDSFDPAMHVVRRQTEWVLKDAAQIQSERRGRRNALLSQSDWTALSDAPLTTAQRSAWAAYRQALRDITVQDPYQPTVWPVLPA